MVTNCKNTLCLTAENKLVIDACCSWEPVVSHIAAVKTSRQLFRLKKNFLT